MDLQSAGGGGNAMVAGMIASEEGGRNGLTPRPASEWMSELLNPPDIETSGSGEQEALEGGLEPAKSKAEPGGDEPPPDDSNASPPPAAPDAPPDGLDAGAEDETETEGGPAEKIEEIPGETRAQFPDADLSSAKVILNSKEADESGVAGFARSGVIYIAPGVPKDEVIRHEAAHLAQQETGAAEEGESGSDAEAESGAEAAEGKRRMSRKELGSASPKSKLNKPYDSSQYKSRGPRKDNTPFGSQARAGDAKDIGEKGAPKMEFNGMELAGVSGNVKKTFKKANWNPRQLAKKRFFFPMGGIPGGKVYVSLGLDFTPAAALSLTGGYSWDKAANQYKVSGTLAGAVEAKLAGHVEGGVGLDAVFQKGGVGIRATLGANTSVGLSSGVAFGVTPGKGASADVSMLKGAIGGDLTADLTARAWTEGLFGDGHYEWNFASYKLAELSGGSLGLGYSWGGDPPKLFQATPPEFKWHLPELTKGAGKLLKAIAAPGEAIGNALYDATHESAEDHEARLQTETNTYVSQVKWIRKNEALLKSIGYSADNLKQMEIGLRDSPWLYGMMFQKWLAEVSRARLKR